MDEKKCSYIDFKKENRMKLFGNEDAGKEDEERLKRYYFQTNEFEEAISDLPLQIIIGEKGTGKSALLKMAYLEDEKKNEISYWIRLDDLTELYEEILDESNIIKLKTLWKKSICRLVCSHIAEGIRVCMTEDEERAIKWAYESGYRQKDFLSKTVEMLKPSYKDKINLDIEGEAQEHRVSERLLTNKRIRLYFDDFDVDWKGTNMDVNKIKGLILALSDLTSDIQGLSARIALRTDVYEMIRNEEFSDKFESTLIKCTWNNQQIIKALAKRICVYFQIDFNDNDYSDDSTVQYQVSKYLNLVFEEKFEGTRVWNNAPIHRVIYSLIRRKPRDMVKLCLSTADIAYKTRKDKIDSQCFIKILEDYSAERMKDVINEYGKQLIPLKEILYKMGPTKKEFESKNNERYVYKTDELYEKIKKIQEQVNIYTYDSKSDTKQKADFHQIAHFLYKIGFITGRKIIAGGVIRRLYYDEAPTMLERNIGDDGYAWEIHPAYRGSLEKAEKHSWFNTINISEME